MEKKNSIIYIFIFLNSWTAAESGETDDTLRPDAEDDADMDVIGRCPAVELPAERGGDALRPKAGIGDNGGGRFSGRGPFGAMGLIWTGGRGFGARVAARDRALD